MQAVRKAEFLAAHSAPMPTTCWAWRGPGFAPAAARAATASAKLRT